MQFPGTVPDSVNDLVVMSGYREESWKEKEKIKMGLRKYGKRAEGFQNNVSEKIKENKKEGNINWNTLKKAERYSSKEGNG